VYFCETEKIEIINTEEGELHWIEVETLNDLKKPKIIEFMLEHYLECENQDNVYVGTMIEELSVPGIRWVELSDPGEV
jgi:8-oxo-dGTP diphosphatase